MPEINITPLNVEVTVLGIFLALYGLFSHVIKDKLYLGEALPALVVGIVFGPYAAKLIQPTDYGWGQEPGFDVTDKMDAITLGVCRIVIGTQLVVTGFQLPKRYILERIKDIMILMVPTRVVMWLITSSLILLVIPKVTFLTSLVIGACVTCTDPILTQAIARGAFADKYVPRHLREIISAEAGATDGFGFPFLMLAVFLLKAKHPIEGQPVAISPAITNWVTETLIWFIIVGCIYGVLMGYASSKLMRFVSQRGWIENEFYLLWAIILGLILVGTCGLVGTDEFTACFAAGCFLNWDGHFHAESTKRLDDINPAIESLLNLGAFAYIGAVMPWEDFHAPETTGLTYPILVGLAFLVFLLRRIPAVLCAHPLLDSTHTWHEAMFMGYFGPIGIGSVFYVEHTKHILHYMESDDEQHSLFKVLTPVVYFLVFASVIVHGLSIPALALFYSRRHVRPIQDPTDVAVLPRRSMLQPMPANAVAGTHCDIVAFNRFQRPEEAMEAEREEQLMEQRERRCRDLESASVFDRPDTALSDGSATAIVPPEQAKRYDDRRGSVWSTASGETDGRRKQRTVLARMTVPHW